jgi:hypothetical protein
VPEQIQPKNIFKEKALQPSMKTFYQPLTKELIVEDESIAGYFFVMLTSM